MTAAYLDAALNRNGRRVCEVRLVDVAASEPDLDADGSLPELNRFLAILGANQRSFIEQVGCTFSQGTRFNAWQRGEGEHFYHPFALERPGSIDRAAQRWLKSNRSIPFAETVSVQPALCDMDLAPLMLGAWDFGPPLAYGFHVDGSRFRGFLKDLAKGRSVEHCAEPAISVELAGDGRIDSVVTESGRRLQADLFVDCSGEAGLLVNSLDADWVDRSQTLLCDRYVSMDVPYDQYYPGHVHPYTSATALSSGWLQDIPLQDRRCLRYFFASSLQSDDAAAATLIETEGRHAGLFGTDVRAQRTRVRAQAWVGNCVAIGSSAGGIEPLESTNLYLVHHAVSMLAEHFPLGDELEPLAYRYNRIVTNRFFEILDFVNLHYCLSRREDSEFWREARQPYRMSNRLAAKLEFWRHKQPTPADFEDQRFPGQAEAPLPATGIPADVRTPVDTAGLWNHENYEAILYGMDFLADECEQWFGTERPDTVVPQHIAARVAQAPRKLPTHAGWLQKVTGMPTYTSR